ncbi:uncharacterized protein LOC123699949 [Colias croceus]|uniref:uncharacterized protein LOC123699949 n=1 Tax=Colias crocea TaxID=72248 RepID=UPI001E27F2D8|nr:uncharacterized protein LOC123699949 [Colias croceus]
MSIPPLVCSTPPPPDQCEDDKDEDFDLQYRLSQEEDEDNNSYDYGNYSSYTNYCQEPNINENEHFKSEPENSSLNVEEKKICTETSAAVQTEFILNETETTKSEDIAVEDLNLKIEQENVISDHLVTHTINNAVDPDTYGISCIVDHLDSPDKTNVVLNENEEDESSDEKSISETNVSPLDNCEVQGSSENTVEIEKEDPVSNEIDIEQHIEQDTIQSEEVEPAMKSTNTDDFDDFEEFKFTETSISNNEVTANFENPWDNNDTEDFSFGDFKANFENNSDSIQPFKEEQINNEEDVVVNKPITNSEDMDLDDDFGDFDDFKSSVNQESEDKPTTETELAHHVTVLNFQSPNNEAQIIESINNIIFNIFPEDLPNCEPEFDKTLDSMLTETWHHLKEVDERQPYMVHWNNSLGQKSLLKALCIDSRNILFGPKWNYFTPKYATSLSVAPLQPQKPAAVPNAPSSEAVNSDKITPKDTSWTDPFTTDGQESSTMEKEKTPREIRPSDLDVFEKAISVTNIDKIHSSTLSVQPLRHISLPDTHIFTPTDSETPRSKTIHYDNGPPVLLPQQIESHNINIEKPPSQHSTIENNDDYWEFQDFKGAPSHTASMPNTDCLQPDDKVTTTLPSTSEPSTNSGITYQTQLLQPVKLEPIMPTLNWPDPGEVKETFDDFSDFISNSNSNWNNDGQEQNKPDLPISKEVNDVVNENSIEDEFETFQSAPTPISNHINHVQSEHNSFEKLEPVIGIQKQMDTLSFKSNEILSSNHTSTVENSSFLKNNSNNFNTKQSPVNQNILQPINSVSTLRAQQGGQILQPLSLESYSQINWPKPGIDLQNLSSFNPLESLQSLKSDTGSSGPSKVASPIHNKANAIQNEISDDDIWGDFVSSKPKQHAPKKTPIFADDDEWTDFVSSPSLSQNSLNTISFNVQSNSNIQKSSNLNSASKSNQNISLDIPTLNYITPKSSNRGAYIDKHFQNL